MTMFPSGRLVLPDNDEVPTLVDMARGLSRIPRFVGQTSEPWSVAEHQLGVALHIRAELGRAGSAEELFGAIHDGHECVTSDIAHFWKTPDIAAWQERFDERFYRHYDLAPPTAAQKTLVKRFDDEALLAEAKLFTSDRTYRYICEEKRGGLSGASEHAIWSIKQVQQLLGPTRNFVASTWLTLVQRLMILWELS